MPNQAPEGTARKLAPLLRTVRQLEMNRKLFFLVGLPLAWFVTALIAAQFHPDRFYLVAVLPSAWLALFGDFFAHTIPEMRAAGLPTMVLVGLVLLLLKMTPRVAVLSSIVLALVLWGAFLVFAWETRAIRASGAPFAWFLCCFDLSLCLLPILALLGIIGRQLLRTFRMTGAE